MNKTQSKQKESPQSNNPSASQFRLELHQTLSNSFLSNERPSSQFYSPRRKVTSKSKLSIQNCLTKVRTFIKQNLIDQAINQIIIFINQNTLENKSWSSSQVLASHKYQNDSSEILNLYFCLAACLLSKKRYSECVQILKRIREKNQSFKRNQISILIPICYRELKMPDKALEAINTALLQFINQQNQKIIDFLFLKGTILKGCSKLDQAQNSFYQVLNKQSNHQQAIKELLEIYQIQNNYQKALSVINKASLNPIQSQKFQKFLIEKRAEFQFKARKYEECLVTIKKLQTKFQPKQSKLNYMKGKSCLKLRKFQQSIIYFNQALQIHSSQHFVRLSLIELIIYFLKQRDFYDASLYCKRRKHLLAQENQITENLSYLAQGLILLMKRNFEEALNTIGSIDLKSFQSALQKRDQVYIKNLCLNAQGFGLFSLGKHEQALEKYQSMSVNEEDEEYLPCYYNIQLINGILYMLREKNEEKAIQCFQTAIDYLIRPQPYFYISVILTQKNIKYEASADVFMKILTILQSGLNVNQTAEMYFYRSLVFIYIGMSIEAIQDLEKAIQISEDNDVEHFYAKGLINFLQQNYEQAVCEFEVALSIDQSYSKAMIQKAKCHIMCGNSEQGYADLQGYREVTKDPTIWELYFMLHERKFEDILQLDPDEYNYQEGSTQAIDDVKICCNFFLGRFEESGPSGKLILALIYETFEDLLRLIDEALEFKVNVGPLWEMDLKFIKGYVLFKLGFYDEAIFTYEDIQSSLSLNDKQIGAEELQLRFLITKINIIFCLYARGLLDLCRDKTQLLINEINEGPVSDQLSNILNVIGQSSTQQKFSQQIQEPILDDIDQSSIQKPYIVELLNNKQMISYFLPLQTKGPLSFKLIIPYPILEIPELKPNRQKLLEDYKFQTINNRPQAPWIKRGQFGVIFTNQVRQFHNLNLHTEENQINPKQKIIDDLKLGSQLLLKLQNIQAKK